MKGTKTKPTQGNPKTTTKPGATTSSSGARAAGTASKLQLTNACDRN